MAMVWIVLAQFICAQLVSGGNLWHRNGVQLYTSTTPFSSYPKTPDQLCFTVKGRADGSNNLDLFVVGCPGGWRYLVVCTETDNNPRADSGPILDFREIEVLGSTINKALNRPTNMSSCYRSDRFLSSEAVDGDITARNPRMIHTAQGQTFVWWTVDLQETVQDPVVRIYFRVDRGNIWRRNGVQLYTSTTPFSSYPGTQDQLCDTVKGRADGSDIPNVLDAACLGTWQYLMVYTDTNNRPSADSGPMLDLGEIQVLVCRDPGTYGVNCDQYCSARQCPIPSSSCDRYHGACPGGCQTGWMGTDCTRKCSYGQYGANCSKYCTSRYCVTSSSTCDRITGECPRGCLSGYEGIDCTEKCGTGTYGPGCNLSCGDRKCLSSTSSCDHVTGRCDGGCQSGWDGTDCTQKCTSGTYGPGCRLSCDNRKCSSNSSCHHVTGLCDGGCQAGWNGTDCTQTCSSDMYGANCAKSCSSRHCVVTSATCDRFNGTCSPDECQAGWSGVNCMEACPRGTYGIGCIYTCGSCTGDDICDRLDGNCPGNCNAGWNGSQCKEPCDREHYGSDCTGICATRHCSSGSTCSSDTGQCDIGCQTGWTGTDCTAESSAAVNITAVVAGSVAAVIVVILIVFVIIIIWRRRGRTDMKDTHGPEPIYYNVGNHRRSDAVAVDPEREYGTIDNLREAEVETISAVAPRVENKAISGNTYEKFTKPSRDQESAYTELQ